MKPVKRYPTFQMPVLRSQNFRGSCSKDQIRQHSETTDEGTNFRHPSHEFVKISNSENKFKLNFGSEFKDLLQPRDQVLEHSFDFTLPISEEDKKNLEDSKMPESISESMKNFLVESASNVTSAAFKFLCKGDLTGDQAKQYASKNMLLNINSIFRETFKGINNMQKMGLIADEKRIDLSSLRQNMVIDVDNMISDILVNLADNYPQAPASGGTPKMRDVIMDLNRIEDQQNDLIFANNIKISDYLNFGEKGYKSFKPICFDEKADYTKFIMEVINTAIRSTQCSQQDYKERTVKEIFTEFNQKLFCLSQQQKYHSMIEILQNQDNNQSQLMKEKKKAEKDRIVDYFNQTLQRDPLKSQKTDRSATKSGELFQFDELDMPKKLQEFKRNEHKTWGVSQKIPSFIKQFSKQEIANQDFTAKHSCILRILTKWAEYLEQIFVHPEKAILKRPYPFKTVDHQQIIINNNQFGNGKLIKELKKQYCEVQKKYEIILRNCYDFISRFLSQTEKANSSVERYASTRTVASKINAVLTSYMLAYTNTLIHHLLKAGQKISTNENDRNVNLVVFRVSDLLRAKLQCSENSFISLLETLYLLDNDDRMKGKIKLVRIKSKLDDPANNIMINYLFMGKVQCELQLSIQQSKGKAKNNYSFSHFIYELTRGKFGCIAECAIMISQLDPMIAACRQKYYVEKKGKVMIKKQAVPIVDQNLQKFQENLKKLVFECQQSDCKKLIISQSQDLFLTDSTSRKCNNCVISKYERPQEQLCNLKLKEFLGMKGLKRIKSYHELTRQNHDQGLIVFDHQGKISFHIVIYVEEELKTYSVNLDSTLLQQIESCNFDFSLIEYIDITKKLRNSSDYSEKLQLIFAIQKASEVSEQIFREMGLKKGTVLSNLSAVTQEFQQFRAEKNLIKTIKFKVGTICTNNNIKKWNELGHVIQELANPNEHKDDKKSTLRYRRYKQVDLTNVTQIYARNMELIELPIWLDWFKDLRTINLESNKLKTVSKGQFPPSVTCLILYDNCLVNVDLSNLTNLTFLDLSRNKLQQVDLSEIKLLQTLRIYKNKIKTIDLTIFKKLTTLKLNNIDMTDLQYLPPTLQVLSADRSQVINFDFKKLARLQKLNIKSEKTKKQEMINLCQKVEFKSV